MKLGHREVRVARGPREATDSSACSHCPAEASVSEEMGRALLLSLVIKSPCLLVCPQGVQARTVTTIFLLLCLLAWTSVLLTTSAPKPNPRVQGGFAGEQRSLGQAAKPSPWLRGCDHSCVWLLAGTHTCLSAKVVCVCVAVSGAGVGVVFGCFRCHSS